MTHAYKGIYTATVTELIHHTKNSTYLYQNWKKDYKPLCKLKFCSKNVIGNRRKIAQREKDKSVTWRMYYPASRIGVRSQASQGKRSWEDLGCVPHPTSFACLLYSPLPILVSFLVTLSKSWQNMVIHMAQLWNSIVLDKSTFRVKI